jgi:hypothetical protein
MMPWLLVLGAALSAAQPRPGAVPPELSALIAKARVDGQLAGWCRGEFRAGRRNAFAAAVASTGRGGRYLVLDGDGEVVELAAFKGGADVSCYTPAEARKLGESIRLSDTISGHIVPKFATTVICAFVEDTEAVCWQYSPAAGAFVKIGEWQT